MRKQCWLINTRSGSGEGARIADTVASHVDVVALDFSHLEEQLSALSSYERVVIVGGDGTFSTVVTSDALPAVPVAFLATGTANDLARDLGTFRAFRGISPAAVVSGVERLVRANLATWECVFDDDVLPFCSYVSLGFEGAIVSDFQAWRSNTRLQSRFLNRCMYVFFALRHLGLRLPRMCIAADERDVVLCQPTRGVLFTNVKSHMGCGFATDCTDPHDDKLECAIVSSPVDYARMIVSATGALSAATPFCQGETFTVTGVPRDTALQVDGEAGPRVQNGEITFRFRKFVPVLVAA